MVRGRPRTLQNGKLISVYMESLLISRIDEVRGKMSFSKFVCYTMDEVINNKRPDLCSIELSHLKKENKMLKERLERFNHKKPLTKHYNDLGESEKRRFIEMIHQDSIYAGSNPKWHEKAAIMVDKYRNLCGLDIRPHEWINLIENNPSLQMDFKNQERFKK